ncbi:Envelope glycoprotein [Gossypium arboreum]|uniref:Envelope glycoprotein n=1 Tax=Gossypium arboreum TaxID=29729 RepID=A0A0B0MGN4_GOSAR|nr:Envelope glycoprotein [Gossypium arboreum]
MPSSYLHTYIGILCHDICILTIPKVHTGLLDVVTRSKRMHEHGYQAYTHSVIAYINSYISFQHIYLTFN